MAEITYTVTLTLPINRDEDEPLTPVEAVEVFRDEARDGDWVYTVYDPTSDTTWNVDMPEGTTWEER